MRTRCRLAALSLRQRSEEMLRQGHHVTVPHESVCRRPWLSIVLGGSLSAAGAVAHLVDLHLSPAFLWDVKVVAELALIVVVAAIAGVRRNGGGLAVIARETCGRERAAPVVFSSQPCNFALCLPESSSGGMLEGQAVSARVAARRAAAHRRREAPG